MLSSLKDILPHSSSSHECAGTVARRSALGGGVLLLLLGLVGLYWVLPEIRRYIHIERM